MEVNLQIPVMRLEIQTILVLFGMEAAGPLSITRMMLSEITSDVVMIVRKSTVQSVHVLLRYP